MKLRHIVVATDESAAGRHAARTAFVLAERAGARVTIIRALLPGTESALAAVAGRDEPVGIEDPDTVRRRLAAWVESATLQYAVRAPVRIAIPIGVPSVEITRFADEHAANLLVLGRKPRSQVTRFLLGDTADAVARQSRVPTLFVSPATTMLERLLVAIDGTEQGMRVLRVASDFAREVGCGLDVVTVEPAWWDELYALNAELPASRTVRLQGLVNQVLMEERMSAWSWAGGGRPMSPWLEVRHGETVAEVLAAVEARQASVLAIGLHRGGPPASVELGSTARRLAHTAPCAVLTVPL